MKRPYQKPLIYVERFELLEHIASCSASSDITVNYQARTSCYYQDGDLSLFNSGVAGCNVDEIMALYNYGDGTDPIDNFLASLDYDVSGGCYNAFLNGYVFAS